RLSGLYKHIKRTKAATSTPSCASCLVTARIGLPGFASAATRFVHPVAIIAAVPGHARNDAAGDADVGVFTRDAVLFGRDPERAGAIVYFINALPERAIRAHDAPGDGHFFVEVATGVVLNVADAYTFGTARQRQRQERDRHTQQHASFPHLRCP